MVESSSGEVAAVGRGRSHEGAFLKHTTCWSGHKRGIACLVEPAQIKQAIRLRDLNRVGVEHASTRAEAHTGQRDAVEPIDEAQKFRLCSLTRVLGCSASGRL